MISAFRPSRLAALVAALLLAGCLDSHKFEQSTTVQIPTTLRGSHLMIYSFLDFRESSFGTDTLAAFERQLPQRFTEMGVTVKVADFRGLPAGKYFSVSNTNAEMPVRRLVDSGHAQEVGFGAQYRLLILPSYTEAMANHFQITWVLMSLDGEKQVWTGRSTMHTDYVWSADHDPEGHAKYLLDPFMAELKKQALTD